MDLVAGRSVAHVLILAGGSAGISSRPGHRALNAKAGGTGCSFINDRGGRPVRSSFIAHGGRHLHAIISDRAEQDDGTPDVEHNARDPDAERLLAVIQVHQFEDQTDQGNDQADASCET